LPRHVRVIQDYAAGKDLAEIAREEKSSRGTILRILRTAPLTLLECAGIIEPTQTGENRNYRDECFTEDSSGLSQRRSDNLNMGNIMNIPEWMGYIN
jgi:hypothetical protein